MLRKMMIGAVVLVGLFATPAAAQYSIIVSPGTVVQGSEVTVSGTGCQPGETVDVTIDAKAKAKTGRDALGTTVADDDGNFSIDLPIPTDLPTGTYTVTATCGSVVQSKDISVVAPTDGTTTSTTVPTGTIPRTGSDVTPMALLGAGLLTGGGLLVLATRKRSRATA